LGLNALGLENYKLFDYPAPTGNEEKSLQYFSPLIYSTRLTESHKELTADSTLLVAFVRANISNYDSKSVLAFLIDAFASNSFTKEEYQELKKTLGDGFDINSPNAPDQLKETIYLIVTMQEGHKS